MKVRRQSTPKGRLPPNERKQQLVAVAGAVLSRAGVDALQFTELAAAAGVTRPIVYKFFPHRGALIAAVLQDFAAELTLRFAEGAEASLSARPDAPLALLTRAFIDAICDTIEEKGAGPWELLGSKGPDPDIAKVAAQIQRRLLLPWRPHLLALTGATPREVTTLSLMIVAAGRAALAQWYGGSRSRAEAARDATRGVSALIEAFSRRTPG